MYYFLTNKNLKNNKKGRPSAWPNKAQAATPNPSVSLYFLKNI
jgi:hypothetical protein